MNKAAITTILGLALSVAAIAQTTPGTTPPSGTAPSTQPQTSPSQTPDTSAPEAQTPAADRKSEKSLKGCIQSAGGQFMLEDKHGKQTPLAGSQDLASHVGHTVTVHGSFASGSDTSSAASASSSGGMSASEQQFTVSKLDMVSEQCNSSKSKNKDTKTDSSKPSPNLK
jgi:hypothetical protein